MEPLYLYDISTLINSKTTERIISSMAAQLCHLIIAMEWEGVDNEAFPDLRKTAEELAKSTEELAFAATRLAEESNDEVLRGEMCPAAESVLLSGKSTLLAAQKLNIQPEIQSHKEELIVSAQRVLMETMQILQIEEDASVRRIIQAADWLLDCLSTMESAGDISAMLAAFRDFSESLLLLNNLTERRIQELRVSPQQKHLAETLQILKKCVPLLHTVKHGVLKHPQDLQVNLSKDYVFALINRTVKELISLLTNDSGNKELRERNGLFSHHLSQLMGLLSSPHPKHFYEGEFNSLVEAVVFYCMILADSSRPNIKLQLINHCHHLLTFWKSISSHAKLTRQVATQSQVMGELVEKCHTMREEVKSLDQAVLTALLCQIVDTFTETKEPLKRLIEAVLEPTVMSCAPAEGNRFLKKLQPLITAFFSHSHQMIKVANFALARCTKINTVTEIEDCVGCLNRLLATVPLLLTEVSKDPPKISMSEHLQSLYHTWAGTTESLSACFDEVISLHGFLDLSVQEMADHREGCEKALESETSGEFSWHAANFTCRAAHIVQVIRRYVDKARDPIFRNGLLVLVKQLDTSIFEVKTATDQCLERISCSQARNTFLRRAKHLVDSACRVREGLDESNHPAILSPLREHIRKPDLPRELTCVAAHELPAPRATHGIKAKTTDSNELLEGFLCKPLQSLSCAFEIPLSAGSLYLNGAPRKVDVHPVIGQLLTATKKHDVTAVNTACSTLLELSNCCVDAAKEALPIVQSPLLEKLTHYRKIVLLTPRVVSLAREIAPNPLSSTDKLLETAILLSERICETKQCLMTVAGSWYSLSQQLFCVISPHDFLKSKQTLDEIMQALALVVQLAGDIACTDTEEEHTVVPKIHERFVRVQAKFKCAQTNTKLLLEKVLSSGTFHSNQAGVDRLEANCVLWSVVMQVLLLSVDHFIGRDVLFLSELRNTMKHKLCLQTVLAAVSESSLRIQEAACLSPASCAEGGRDCEILVLRQEIKILTEAVLQVAGILSVSLVPTPNLSVRFELLQRELAIRAQTLILYLNSTNQEFLRVIQSVVQLALPCAKVHDSDREMIRKVFEERAGRMMANVQQVKTVIKDALQNTACLNLQESLLSATDHLLLLTLEVIGRASKLLQSQQDKELFQLDNILWEWAAKAHWVVTQLQSVPGIRESALELIKLYLQNSESHNVPHQHYGTAQLFQAEIPGTKNQSCAVFANSAESSLAKSEWTGLAARETFEMLPHECWKDPHASNGESLWGALRPETEALQDDTSRLGQVTRELATQMFHMTQFLKRKGPITTKEQLVDCAGQVASKGQVFVKFGHIIAKNCLDDRCAPAVLRITEQIQTISSQLSILARVKAAIAGSRCSAELLVNNAQNLIQAVLQLLKAAEAACIKGLRQPSPDSEEGEVAAFCTQWKKTLLWHRTKEALNPDRDELGLRKTRAGLEPTLTALVQGPSSQC
ncbi:uncharacterized protein LOC112551352 [Alligator sinensis]|uniref:Uncharacterized protein LOC112551352 n=1 Tax=Alligator sinensis TaxID=38654 RepID=A0A3Q0H6H3_ALLSI|nr:uncharacterized protein LOC112551352 [Alligator sinensis]